MSFLTTLARRTASIGLALTLTAETLLVPGCKPGATADKLTSAPDMASATGQAKCGVKASASKPLIVEWPAADRAALESRARQGLVAVRYSGCEMEVLTTCTANGSYAYHGLTVKHETVSIKNADELYANLPVGAIKLEAKLERTGQLNVDMLIVGRQESSKHTFSKHDLDGRCDAATHVVTGLTTGAFSFYTGAAAQVGGGVEVSGIAGAGAGSSSEKEILSRDGDAIACQGAASTDAQAPEGCAALLRVEVVPIDGLGATTASSGGATNSGTSSGSGRKLTDTGPSTGDPDLDKKVKAWRLIAISSYILALGGGAGLLYGGLFLSNKGKKDLTSALAGLYSGAGTAERRDAIKKQQAAGYMVGAGIGAIVVFGVLGLYANVRWQKLKKSAVALTPTPLRKGGGFAVGMRF